MPTSPIRKYRERAKMSQAELSRKVGVSLSLISRWESGTYEPRVADARRMAEALKLPHWVFLYKDCPSITIGVGETYDAQTADATG